MIEFGFSFTLCYFALLFITFAVVYMSFLLQKSEFNLSSAKILIEKSNYAPSVHCSYYSCLQMMLHILVNKKGKSEDVIDEEIDANEKGRHIYLINLFTKEIKEKTNDDSKREFNNKIHQLRKLRIESDYRDVQIFSDKGTEAFKIAENIRLILKKNFGI